METVPTSDDSGQTNSAQIEQFIADHSIQTLHVPEAQCPECYRTLLARAVHFVPGGQVVWQMQCPTHRSLFGIDAQ